MTSDQLSKKRMWFILLTAYFVVGYFFCNYLNMYRSHYFNIGFPFEHRIPFIPIFILGYLIVYFAVIFIYVSIDDYDYYKKAVRLFFVVSTIHYIVFLLFPVKMIRPDMVLAEGIMSKLTYYYYLIDHPTNCFPSMHVSYPLAGALIMWNHKRKRGYVLAALTLIVAVSVVMVKQHYIMDIAGAIVVASVVYKILKP